ncbi:sequestosome-1 [Apis cerana]|uniref:sequestosome-1 n=1 Tax=Apis cerana TaxID=7461 RepID=UPI0007E2C3D2|nr:sequestosome-1 [Apis cerana]
MKMFKAYLQNSDFSIKEIRKFNLYPSNLSDKFEVLCNKIKELFPELNHKSFTISWKDNDGDQIVMSSEDELKIAFNEIKNKETETKYLAIYIKPTIQKEQRSITNPYQNDLNEKIIHFGITCDGCDNDIIGFRYKCIQCEDYDLCAQCEATGIHPHHCMIRMPQPLKWHHSRSLHHHLRKIFKKNGVHFNKKTSSNENKESQGIHCNIYPWFETYAPYLNNFIDALLEVHNVESNSSKVEKKEESKNNSHMDDNDSKKFPGEGRKLFDDSKDDKESVSDVASTTSQDSNPPKTADEWTIIDTKDTTEANHTASTSSNVNETNEKEKSSSMAPSAPNGTSIYPELPKEKIIHHQNPIINEAVENMIKMGFSNQGGLLTYLLDAENGDINKVLEILQPTNKR